MFFFFFCSHLQYEPLVENVYAKVNMNYHLSTHSRIPKSTFEGVLGAYDIVCASDVCLIVAEVSLMAAKFLEYPLVNSHIYIQMKYVQGRIQDLVKRDA